MKYEELKKENEKLRFMNDIKELIIYALLRRELKNEKNNSRG